MKVSFYRTLSGNEPVKSFIKSLPKRDQGQFAEVLENIIKYGLDSHRVTFKPLGGKLWEIKFNFSKIGYRILYILMKEQHIILLHAFKNENSKNSAERTLSCKKKSKGIFMKKKRVSFSDVRPFIDELLEDPEIRIIYEAERVKSQIARAVIVTRKKAGLTQVGLAKKIGTTQSAIARLESGSDSRTPSLMLLARIASACNASFELGFKFNQVG